MRRLIETLVSDRVVLVVILLNTVALFLHEMAAPGAAARSFWFWAEYAM
jgi:hypothetical protein